MDVLVEVHGEETLEGILNVFTPEIIGVNNRNLKTFETSVGQTERMAKLVPSGRTSTARAPHAFTKARSSDCPMPLSLIRTLPDGTSFAIRSVCPTDVSKVFRFRLFTPMISGVKTFKIPSDNRKTSLL